MSSPLEGITVVEIANWVAAPSATALMADMGASVIKVEPPEGDSMRGKLRQPRSSEGELGIDVSFQLVNRGKRSVALDLGDQRGQDLVRRLSDRADVVVTNLTRARLERYGLGPEQLHQRNPSLIYALVTGQGSTGAGADQLAFDVTAFFGRGGVTALLGEPNSPPVQPRTGQGDQPTGLALLVAILGALRVRDRTGEGQLVETALMQVGAWSVGCDVATALVDHRQPSRRSRRHPISPMNTMYQCADGAWLILSSHHPATWPRLCRALGLAELAEDPRFSSARGRLEHAAQLVEAFDAVFASAPWTHWAQRLEDTGVIWAKMAELPELVEDPQAKELQMFTEIEHPVAGRLKTLSAPFSFSRSQVSVKGRAPEIGEHSIEVLEELGCTRDEIDALGDAGVLMRARSN